MSSPPVTTERLIRWVILALAPGLTLLIALILKPWGTAALGGFAWLLLIPLAQLVLVGALVLLKRTRLDAAAAIPYHVRILEATTRELPRIRQLGRLLTLTARIMIRYLGARHAAIYVDDRAISSYRVMASSGAAHTTRIEHVDQTSALIRWLLQHRRPLTPADCPRGLDKRQSKSHPYARLHLILQNLDAQLVVPSFQGKRLLGFLVLSQRQRPSPVYTKEDTQALVRLAQGCAIALDNARSYEQLKTTAQKLHTAQDRLVRQERMVAAGRLAMGLAHEIKNPLSAIKTFSEFLPERYEDAAFREEFAQIVGKEVDRISQIVQSLSDFAKPMLLKLEPVNVQQIVKETLLLLSNDCLKRTITIKQHYESVPILAPADPSQLKQALLNLCMNALQAMEPGGTLTVDCKYQDGQVRIRIADTGVGIPKEHLPVLFDPFFTTKDSGMGLGLAVVRQIVEEHYGTIRVESEVGKGSSFEIRLPWAMRFTGATAPRSASLVVPESDPLVCETPLNLLIIDDEPKVCALLKQDFEAKGCHVQTAGSGEQGLELLAKERPHLVLLDLKLQDMDGFQVLRHLKPRYPSLPVVVITGLCGEEIEQHVRELGALACFHKPLDLTALQRHVFAAAKQLAEPH